MNHLHPAHRPLADSALALFVACAAGAWWLVPAAAGEAAHGLRQAAMAAVVVLAALWHWVSLARAAHRAGQSVAAWLGLSVLLFPVGGAAALLLLWLGLQSPVAQRLPALR